MDFVGKVVSLLFNMLSRLVITFLPRSQFFASGGRSISPSNEYSGLISFRMDRLDLLAVQGTLKHLLFWFRSHLLGEDGGTLNAGWQVTWHWAPDALPTLGWSLWKHLQLICLP